VEDDTVVEAIKSVGGQGDPVTYRRLLDRVGKAVFKDFSAPSFRVGRYELLDVLGRGGRGVVYRAVDCELDREVAVKLLHLRGQLGATGEDDSTLIREARATAKLSHPNVVSVYDLGTVQASDLLPDSIDLGELDSKVAYVVMELVEGDTLGEWLKKTPRSWRDIVRVFIDAGEGLAAAHAQGIVHRDFKPSNVVVGLDGRARVLDFGLARWLEPAAPTARVRDVPRTDSSTYSSELSRSGVIAGTPAYMAPEQHLGSSGDVRVDQFGFCVSLYEALYRCRPFTGSSVEALARAKINGLIQRPEHSGHVPPVVRRAVEKGLRPGPEGRHPDMPALLRILGSALRPRWPRYAAAALLMAIAGGGLIAWATRPPDPLSCRSDSTQLMEDVWSPDHKQRVDEHLGGLNVPFAAQTGTSVVRALDEYRGSWEATRREVCKPGSSRQDQVPRLRCLESRRQSVAALVEVLSETDASSSRHAVRAAEHLPAVYPCLGKAHYESTLDPEFEGRLMALRETARFDEALALVDEELKLTPDVAQRRRGLLLAEKAEVYFSRGALDDAEVALEQAAQIAEAIDDDEMAAGVLLTKGAVLNQRGQFDAAELLLDAAELRSADASPEISLRVKESRMAVAFESFRTREAFELLGQLEAEYAGIDKTKARELKELRAVAEIYQGDAGRGVAILRPLVENDLERLGRDHPRLIELEMHLAYGESLLGNTEAFLHHARSAHASATRNLDAGHPNRLQSAVNVGVALRHAERSMDAIRWLRRASEDAEQHLGARSQVHSWSKLELGASLRAAGRLDEARAALQRSVDARRSAFGGAEPATAAALLSLVELEMTARAYDRASPLLDQAIEILDRARDPKSHSLTLAAKLWNAELRWREGDEAEARQALTDVWRSMAAQPPPDPLSRQARLLQAAELEASIGDLGRARALLEEIERDALNPENRLRAAMALFEIEPTVHARTLQAAFEPFDDPEHASAQLARALHLLGRTDEARVMLRRQLDADDVVVDDILSPGDDFASGRVDERGRFAEKLP